MTPSELKLGATAAGLLLLLAGSITWVVYDWVRRREKRKRHARKMERYDRWIDAQIPGLITRIDGLLSRIRAARLRKDRLRQFYDDIQTDEYWEQWFNEKWAEDNAPRNPNGRIGRPKIDGYYYYWESDR